MRVLQVLSSLNVNSGVANVVMNYYRNIDRERVQFDFLIFTNAPNNFHDEVKQMGGRIFKFTQPGLTTYFKAEKELKEFFSTHGHEFDIIHSHAILISKMVFKYARKYGNVKCISHSHNTKLSEKPIRAIRNRILVTGLAKVSDYCFACSKEAGQNAFGKKIINDKKYKTIYNAINIDNYVYTSEGREEIREEFELQDKFVLGNVGRLCSQKNQKFAVDVLKTLLSRGMKAVLLLVGKGGMESELKKYVQEQRVDDYVIFTGIRDDISQILSAMDCFVFPSIFEGFGIALLEAQASGLDCLCFENMPEEVIVSDKIQTMPIKSDCNQWADKIINIEISHDRQYYSKLLKSKGLDIEKQGEELEKLYCDIKENDL